MSTINTAVQLSSIRGKIDAQQQLIGRLELELQEIILGNNALTYGDVFTDPAGGAQDGFVDEIYTNHPELGVAMFQGVVPEFNPDLDMTASVDQTSIRQMLYQARALLGELRVEEQHWNTEVNEEKSRRKDLGDFAKG